MRRESIERIEFRKLHFAFAAGDEVLRDLDFTFTDYPSLVLQGPMGSGKGTVMKILLGLVSPTGGEYVLNGKIAGEMDHTEFDCYRLNMGFSFDSGGLINNLSLFENLSLPLTFHGLSDEARLKESINDRLHLFKLVGQARLMPALVTSGAKKVVNLLKAFILNPELIILDNPTLGLNAEQVSHLVALLNEHRSHQGLKYLIVKTNDASFIQQVQGKIVHVEDKTMLVSDHSLTKAS